MTMTNLEAIKGFTKSLAYNVKPTPCGTDGILAMMALHPFIRDMYWAEKAFKNQDTEIGDKYSFTHQEIFEEWYEDFCKRVDAITNLTRIYMLWLDPWKMTFMKYCGDDMSEKDFAEFLAESWITEENPNMDVNVSREEALDMFKSAKKRYLMTKEDLEYYKALPSEITVYRGVSKGRIDLGLSWTDDRTKAEWFMKRFKEMNNGDEMKLLKVTTSRNNAIAYLNTRGEREVLLDVFACQNDIERIV